VASKIFEVNISQHPQFLSISHFVARKTVHFKLGISWTYAEKIAATCEVHTLKVANFRKGTSPFCSSQMTNLACVEVEVKDFIVRICT
jgi:hypothetical protein